MKHEQLWRAKFLLYLLIELVRYESDGVLETYMSRYKGYRADMQHKVPFIIIIGARYNTLFNTTLAYMAAYVTPPTETTYYHSQTHQMY